MLSSYRLKIANFHNIPIGNVKKLIPIFFSKEKYVLHYGNLLLYFKLELKLKKYILEFNQSQWLRSYVEFNTLKRLEAKKNWNKDGKALLKLMNNAVYVKITKNLRNRIDITNAKLHSTKPELRFCAGSNLARGMSEIRDDEDLWQWSRLEIRLNVFCR